LFNAAFDKIGSTIYTWVSNERTISSTKLGLKKYLRVVILV